MTTISGSSLCKSELAAEIHMRLELMEAESESILRNFRALPESHPRRFALLRQLEIAAAITGELADLEGLITGRSDPPAPTIAEPLAENRPPRRPGRPREL